MADTTPAKVKSIAKHLKNVENDTIQMYIDDAKLEVAEYTKVPDGYVEKLQRYLAAHLATLDYRRPESQKIGDLQTQYAGPGGGRDNSGTQGLDGTKYGQEFKRLLRKYDGPKLKVI